MELTLINEDGEISHYVNVKNMDHARAYVRDFNKMNYHKFMGKFQGKLIEWDGKLIRGNK